MRKFAIAFGLIGSAILATAAFAADGNDGPGMTPSQKIGSLFGLIDVAEPSAPPPPPGMPAMGHPGTVRMQPRSGSNTGNRSTMTHNGGNQSAPMMQNNSSGYNDPSLPQPPRPQRISNGGTNGLSGGQYSAMATDAPSGPRASALMANRPQTSPGTQQQQQRTSIVNNSKQPLFTTPTGAASTNNSTNNSAAAMAQAPTSSRRVPTGNPTTTASPTVDLMPTPIPMSKPIPVNKPEAPATTAAPTVSPNEPFTPSVPQFSAAPPVLTAPSVASSSQPSMLPPPVTQQPAAAPIPVNRPESVNVAPPTTITVAPPNAGIVTPPMPTVDGRPGILSTHTSPELTIETTGPRTIAVGRDAAYRILIRNRGAVEARDVVVLLEVPQHAEVVELHGTSGSSTSAEEAAAGKPLVWQLDLVPAKSQEELTVTLVPRKSEAFELGVRWSSSTPTARATVEVQEPKLTLDVSGPSEVSFGEQRLYKLTVTNPGNGTAENVILQLQPLSPGDGEPLSHVVGNLRAGESNSIEVELTARQAGVLKIRAAALAEGGLKSEAAADVTVRRANLEVVAAAPRMLFAAVPGTYEVRVRNTGDDTARNVKLTVDLPSVAKLLTTMPQATSSHNGGPLAWTFERIAPGSEQVCTIKCAWDGTGRQQLTIIAAGDGDLRKSAVAVTEVQAVADLALDVVDTPGPVPVGQPVTYEIHVKNRGLKSAEGVDVVAYFSEGIEPDKADGHTAEMQPGMVIFRTLPTVGPGQERILKVTARAQTAGNHRLRVELQSAAPQTQLSHEDATFFYADEPAAGGSTPAAAPLAPPSFQPQTSAPIRPTGSTLPAGTATNVVSPIAPTLPPAPVNRTNTLR